MVVEGLWADLIVVGGGFDAQWGNGMGMAKGIVMGISAGMHSLRLHFSPRKLLSVDLWLNPDHSALLCSFSLLLVLLPSISQARCFSPPLILHLCLLPLHFSLSSFSSFP